MEMENLENSELELHNELRQCVEANKALIPSAILDEIRPGLDLDLLFRIKEAIEHLSAIFIEVPEAVDEQSINALSSSEDVHNYSYAVQRAAVDAELISAFTWSGEDLLHPEAFSWAEIDADANLANEKEKYDRKFGYGASDNIGLFGY